jgi:hypothetical protein
MWHSKSPYRSVECHPAARTTPSELSRTQLVGLVSATLAGQLTTGRSERCGGGCDGGCAFGPPAASRPCPAGSTRGSVRWNRDAASAWPCPPARWVGWSLTTRPRAVTPGERPDDPPARGDRHPAPSLPARGLARPTDVSAGRSPTTPIRAPHRLTIGAAGRAASTAGRSTAMATCSIWSRAPGRWRRSWTGCGGSGGRAGAAPSENQRAMRWTGGRVCRRGQLGWCHAAPRPGR